MHTEAGLPVLLKMLTVSHCENGRETLETMSGVFYVLCKPLIALLLLININDLFIIKSKLRAYGEKAMYFC